MVKKIIAVATAILMLCCMVPLAAFADDVLDTCPKCGKRTYETWNDCTTSIPDIGLPLSCKRRHCTSCQYTYYDWNCMGFTGYKDFDSGSGNLISDYLKEWKDKTFGKNATAKKYETGGGSAGTGGVGRHPSGYADDTGTPSVSPTGAYTVSAPLRLYPLSIDASSSKYAVDSPTKIDNYSFTSGNIAIVGTPSGIKVTNGGSSDANITFGGGYRVNVSAAGYLSVASGVKAYTGMGSYCYSSDDAKELWSIEHPYRSSNKGVFGFAASKDTTYFVKFGIKGDYNDKTTSDFTSCDVSVGFNTINLIYIRIGQLYGFLITPKLF